MSELALSNRKRFRPSPFVTDLINTAWTSLAVMVSLVLVTRWLAGAFSTDEFGVYGLSRRVVASIAIYSSAVGVSLTRYLALATDAPQRRAYLMGGALFALVPGLAFLGLGALAPGFWARVVFHDASLGPVLLATLFLVLATAAFNLLYAYYRGTGRVRLGNTWQVCLVGLVPAVVAAGWGHTRNVALINSLTALGMCLALIPVFLAVLPRADRGAIGEQFKPCLRSVLQYGVPRVPGGFAFGALMAVGPFLAPRFSTIAEAGFLVAGQSLLRVVEVGTASFGVVALPRIVELHARGERAFICQRVEDIIALAWHLGLFASVELLLWSDIVVRAWLGDRYLAAIPIVRIILVSAVPYLSYTLLRSVLDAVDERAITTRNTVYALVVTVIASIVAGVAGWGGVGLAAAATLGLLVLGGLSVLHLVRLLELSAQSMLIGRSVGLILLVVLATLGYRALLPANWPPVATLAAGGAFGSLAGILYIAALRRLRTRWISEFEGRILRTRTGP